MALWIAQQVYITRHKIPQAHSKYDFLRAVYSL